MQEEVAKIVYDAMCWAAKAAPPPGSHVPNWVQGGNSSAQDEARTAASKIANIYLALK